MRDFVLVALMVNLASCSPTCEPSSSWQPISIDSTISKNSAAEELIAPYRELIDEEMNRILVRSDTIIYKVQPESPLSNLVADLSFERATLESDNQGLPKPDFCLLNFGGLRVDLPEGEITVRKVFELMPFENELVVIELTTDSLQSLLKYLRTVGGQPVSELRMTWNDTGDISEILVEGQPMDPQRNYLVVTTDYLANGGDKMRFFQNPTNRYDLGIKLRDAIKDHFEQLGNYGKRLNPKQDGRLIIKHE